jgi:hypothetical protein
MDLISIDAPAARVAAAGEALKFLDASLGIVASNVHGRLEVPAWDRHGLFDAELRGQLFELGKIRHTASAKAQREFGWVPRPVDADTGRYCEKLDCCRCRLRRRENGET